MTLQEAWTRRGSTIRGSDEILYERRAFAPEVAAAPRPRHTLTARGPIATSVRSGSTPGALHRRGRSRVEA